MRSSLLRHVAAVGVTHVTRGRAWTLIVSFLATIYLVPLIDLCGPGGMTILRAVGSAGSNVAAAWAGGGRLIDRVLSANGALKDGCGAFEEAIEDHSLLARFVRPAVQETLLAVGAGNEKAYPGRRGWLFFRPEVDYLVSPSFAAKPQSPETAIAAFAAELALRGIRLVLVPIPGKPLVHPEEFSSVASPETPPQRPDWDAFRTRVANACVAAYKDRRVEAALPAIVDPTAALWEQKNHGAQYLKTDTHWRPEAMQAAAALVAKNVLRDLPRGTTTYRIEPREQHGRGDTSAMLRLPEDSAWNAPEQVTLPVVLRTDGSPWEPDPSSPVLLLGDSYSNIYSQGALGWGEGAGLAEQLSVLLGFPVDSLTRNDDGAASTRRMLAEQLGRGNDRLAGKKVVVWQFAMRELVTGRWDAVAFRQPAASGKFLTVSPGSKRTMRGVVRAMGSVPRPAETPYKDYLTAFLIEGIWADANTEALVYLPTMKNHEITPAGRLRAGDQVALLLTNWQEVEKEHGTTNRSELEDAELMIEEPSFGTLLP